MEVTGRVKLVNPAQQISQSFRKRELVVTTDEQYPQHIMIEFTQDRCDLLDAFNVGEEVRVSINLRGREWTNPQGEVKYFNSIQGWRIEKLVPVQAAPSAMQTTPPLATDHFEAAPNFNNEEEHDDLPF